MQKGIKKQNINNKCGLLSHPLTHLHGDLSNGPSGVVTHGDKLWVQVEPQDGHELSWREDMDTMLVIIQSDQSHTNVIHLQPHISNVGCSRIARQLRTGDVIQLLSALISKLTNAGLNMEEASLG